MTMESAAKVPLSERINLRLIAFFIIIASVVGFLVVPYVRELVTGGIRDAGGGYTSVNLKAMGNFEFDGTNGTVNDVPPQFRNLDGKNLVLEGEMYPGNEASGSIHNFQLVYSIAKCCFNG